MAINHAGLPVVNRPQDVIDAEFGRLAGAISTTARPLLSQGVARTGRRVEFAGLTIELPAASIRTDTLEI